MERASANRLHQANTRAPPLSRGFTIAFPASAAMIRTAVQWEQWVLTSVSRDSYHAGHLGCSKNYLYLEPRYGIEP